MTVRPERAQDVDAIRKLVTAAFPTAAEARLVDRLRARGRARLGHVAEVDGEVRGHVMFSPVTVAGAPGGLGLAPLAVAPAHQGQGLGGELIRAGLAACRAAGVPFVVLLGAPGYYSRFGFERADRRGLGNEYGASDAFQVLELAAGGIPASGGLVRYCAEFAEFGGGE